MKRVLKSGILKSQKEKEEIMEKENFRYNNFVILEQAILSCLLQKPELTEKLILEPKHFTKHKSTYLFMKSFYNKFKNYDFILMSTVCVDKWNLINDITDLLQIVPTTVNFGEYQQQLIALHEGDEIEKNKIKQIVNLAIELKAREITTEEFKRKVENI